MALAQYEMNQTETVREAVGLFHDHESMQSAIEELQLHEFERRHISVVGNEPPQETRFGDMQTPAEAREDDPDISRSPNVTPQELGVGQGVLIGVGIILCVGVALALTGDSIAMGGPLTAIVVALLFGVFLGGYFAKRMGDKYDKFFQDQIDRGGLLVWVRTESKRQEGDACNVLKKHGARDVHVHDINVSVN